MLDCRRLALGIVPGPSGLSADEFSSDSELRDLVDIDPVAAADALLRIQGIKAASSSPPASWDWEAELDTPDAAVRFRMTLLEPDEGGPYWGGFSLSGLASVAEICRVTMELRRQLGSVWIHDGECTMRTPGAFEATFSDP